MNMDESAVPLGCDTDTDTDRVTGAAATFAFTSGQALGFRHLEACYGGGVLHTSKSFLWSELQPHLKSGSRFQRSVLVERYELVKYACVDSLEDVERVTNGAFALDVPVAVIAPRCNVEELKAICVLHRIGIPGHISKPTILDLVLCHVCDGCDDFLPVFVPCTLSAELQSITFNQDELDSLARKVKFFSLDELRTFVVIPEGMLEVYRLGAQLTSLAVADENAQLPLLVTEEHISVITPWLKIASKGPLAVIHFVAKVHGVPLLSRASKAQALASLETHECHAACKGYRATFTPLNALSATRTPRKIPAVPFVLNLAPPTEKRYEYPPAPFSDRAAADMISNFCEDTHPSRFEESGCSVCGQLTLLSDLSDLDDLGCSLSPLVEHGLVRMERASVNQYLSYDTRPVLDRRSSSVCCSACAKALRNGRRPVKALANGLWLGEVPRVLSHLSFAEQCLISRVRTNRCVVRVSCGQLKMMANAISFPCPTVKVYKLLPPRRDELDEVLAFIYTGPNAPSEHDLGRTPMLVRRNAVADALEWLKLNHCDYSDLQIDRVALESYPLHGVPVAVVFKPDAKGTNIVPSATSAHDTADEDGAESGECPMTVNGLVGSHLESMSTLARKAAAIQHLKTGGHVLAVGNSETPETLFDNPQLYPQMYPWLFPYGAGGPGNARTRGIVSEASHKRWLLMYHDKRFQNDSRFVIVAFNHEQIKRGSSKSFILAKRANFNSVVSRVCKLNPAVVMSIANRLREGERVVPCTDDERTCFSIMDQVEHIGGSIQGSLASKKNMRSELWSLVNYKGAPSWFITLSPADNRHPICIYWADKDIRYNPALRHATERVRLVARNPVAGARFFHFMVQLLIKHLLAWGNGDCAGIFGHTAAYYGTVEQQGRMTLHLHMLVWVHCALSPQEVRDRLLSEDSRFVEELVAYIDHCQTGEFSTGNMRDMEDKFSGGSSQETLPDPTQVLPNRPPRETVCNPCVRPDCQCVRCTEFRRWTSHYHETVDHVLFLSNVHKCYVRRDVLVDGVKKKHVTGKGCLNKDGVCTARFPRETFRETVVDAEGRLSLRKREPMINSINKVMSYCFRCNTDCTCLLSGTAVKATVGYVADYIVKMGLKTYQIFSSIYDVFERSPDVWTESRSDSDAARRLILMMANSLTSKIEIGGPMAAMYLLGHPDHYSSHSFVVFYWRPYVQYVLNVWREASILETDEDNTVGPRQVRVSFAVEAEPCSVGVLDQDNELYDGEQEIEGDSVVVARSGGMIFSRSRVDDYRLRPAELSAVCLFDWVQCSQRVRFSASSKEHARYLLYAEGHPLRDSHRVLYDTTRMVGVVPNFVGPLLPRSDGDDREDYCCTMMTFFLPWITGLDLKSSDKTWSEAFDEATFSSRHTSLMQNMNIRYECYDARDDFHAQLRVRLAAQQNDADNIEDDDESECDLLELDAEVAARFEDEGATGVWSTRMLDQMKDMQVALQSAGWVEDGGRRVSDERLTLGVDRMMPPKKWKDLVARERSKILNSRALSIPGSRGFEDDLDVDIRPMSDARIIPGSYLLSKFQVNDVDIVVCMEQVVYKFRLNKEQERAFRIAANHSLCLSPEPLRMYIGGMGGTGKTQVIRALLDWFDRRGEGYRMAILAPTGSAASIVNGSTYHSFLGVRTGERRGHGESGGPALEEARSRMRGVDYIFLDEMSMVSCQDLFLIDSRLKEITQLDDLPFGGVNMVVAGDFAQLPPPKGLALYSGQVSRVQQPRQVQSDQENTLGLLLWHQFVVVVILTQNMRQNASSEADKALRRALEHMRYKDCTAEDIHFLRSLIPGHSVSLNLADEVWRDVSVITALNVHKDQINIMNAHRFALENNTPLHLFYSVDRQVQQRATRKTPKKAVPAQAERIRLTAAVQRALWKSQPHTSDHIAGCVPLCLGMPVMIRHNEATELCITKGQEAVVIGWTSREHPIYQDHFVLDVLFVELVNPPKAIKLPYLRSNVVPLTKITTAIKAVLPNDLTINLSRQQVPVLLNFAMTDYASQGKTREVNIVDMKYCRNHQAMYTCLSRGRFAHQTAILRDFDVRKITGGVSGHLREEFRALQLLDEITEAHYSSRAPSTVMQRLRSSTILAYRQWCKKGRNRAPSGDGDEEHSNRKRKGSICEDMEPSRKKGRTCVAPESLSFSVPWTRSWVWDAVNWSCAYDCIFTILRSIWTHRRALYEQVISSLSAYTDTLGIMFRAIEVGRLTLDDCRESLRARLWVADRVSFPMGPTGTDLFYLMRTLLGVSHAPSVDYSVCCSCHAILPGFAHECMSVYTVMRTGLTEPCGVADYMKRLYQPRQGCPHCGGVVRLVQDNGCPGLLCVQLPSHNLELVKTHLILDREMRVEGTDFSLIGIIYWCPLDYHFAARVFKSRDEVYRYDGMLNSGMLSLEDSIALSSECEHDLARMGNRAAVTAIYVVDET